MIPMYYVTKNFVARKLTTSITILGIACVVAVLTAAMMMALGVRKAMVATGSEDNIIVTRKSSTGEITSIIDRETAANILTLPQVAKKNDGTPIASLETVSILNLTTYDGGMSNISIRGVSAGSFELRPNVKISEGRMFTGGAREVIVGKSIPKKFKNSRLGDVVRIAGDNWRVVGLFEAGGSASESEIWTESEQLLSALNRTSFSTITFKTTSTQAIATLRAKFAGDPRLNQFEPEVEQEYFAKQSEMLSSFIAGLGIFTSIFFAIGAVIGASITMYTAVANRTPEIGTLRALGFSRGSVRLAFLLESLLIALVGGVLGVIIATFLSFVSISTMNFASFSEVSFGFALHPIIVLISLGFSLLMGVIGGVLPAWRASNLKILDALRAS